VAEEQLPRLIAALRAFADGLEDAFPFDDDKDTPQVISNHKDQLGSLLIEFQDSMANGWWRSLSPAERVAIFERESK
jgi:hypothetical protein